MKSTADVVIVGAGVIGCSTAYHLAAGGIVDVAVVEMGQVGSGSTSKSAAMLSLQFCHDELSAAMAQLSYAHYMQFEQEIGVPIDFKRTGWLSVATAGDAAELLEGARMLNGLGIATEVLDPAEIRRRYPEIRTDDLAVGTFGPDDGPFDPHMIVWGYARRAMALGGRVHQGVRAIGIKVAGGRVAASIQRPASSLADRGQRRRAVGRQGRPLGGRRNPNSQPVAYNSSDRHVSSRSTRPSVCRRCERWLVLSTRGRRSVDGYGLRAGGGSRPIPQPARKPLMRTIDAAVHRVPVLESASILTTWTGVRPLTPDGRSILGFAPGVEGFLLNCGWGRGGHHPGADG